MLAGFAEFSVSTSAPGFWRLKQRSLRVVLSIPFLVLGFWAWGQGFAGPYHFDDFVTPLNDPASQSLAAWREYLPVTLRPVTKLSYALEESLAPEVNVAARRGVSVAIHLAAATLLYLLIMELSIAPQSVVAGVLAAMWFLHPVHADNILLISGRSAELAALFLLASLLAMERSRLWLSALLFLLACLSRETALAGLLPLTVLAVSRPGATWQISRRGLFPSLLAGTVALAWILTTPRYLALAEFSFLGRPFWSSVVAQVSAVPVGLSLLLQPGDLSIDYGLPLPSKPSDPLFLLGVVMYLAAVAGVVLLSRHHRVASVGLALWLAALLPTQSLVPKLDALSNRPLGLALAGLLLVTAPLLIWLLRRTLVLPRTTAAAAVSICCVTLLAVTASITVQRAALFSSDLRLWQDAASKSLTNSRPYIHYALRLQTLGRMEEAHQTLAVARRIDPFDPALSAYLDNYRTFEVSR